MTKVLNRQHLGSPFGAVYVGRPSKWGNPFLITDPRLPGGLTKAEKHQAVVDEYRRYIHRMPELMASLPELKGKDLICWCSPLPCHADVLMELANREVKSETKT